MIDIVGHFGSRFSFATVAGEIARGLKAVSKLGRVVNFDDKLFEAHADLEEHLNVDFSSTALFVTLPAEHIVQFTQLYRKSALFISPNTDTLGKHYLSGIRSFDRVYVPSIWCRDTLAIADCKTQMIPIGCESIYLSLRESVRDKLKARLDRPVKVLHLMTDGFLPGRKGTVEVIRAWNELKNHKVLPSETTLTLHCPHGVADEVYYYAAHSKLYEPEVTIQAGANRGVPAVELAYLMSDHDLIILPSRCEGFGMMILAALTLGIPTITTNWTGQMDFVQHSKGWIGPSGHPFVVPNDPPSRYGTALKMATVENEYGLQEAGLAPMIEYQEVADFLHMALDPEKRREMLLQSEREEELFEEYTWDALRPVWAQSLIEWSEK